MLRMCCGKTDKERAKERTEYSEARIRKQLSGLDDKHPRAEDLKQLINMFDSDRDGIISRDEVVCFLKKLKVPIDAKEIKEMVFKYKTEGNFGLSYQQFSDMMTELLQQHDFPLLDTFNYFDTDEDGLVSVEEFITAMRCIGEEIPEAQAREAMAPYFVPGTECINFAGFLKINKEPTQTRRRRRWRV